MKLNVSLKETAIKIFCVKLRNKSNIERKLYMKKFFALFVASALIVGVPAAASADVHVRGHVRDDGTYVPPHYRSNPDDRRDNNWSHIGNTNPYTGKKGTRRN